MVIRRWMLGLIAIFLLIANTSFTHAESDTPPGNGKWIDTRIGGKDVEYYQHHDLSADKLGSIPSGKKIRVFTPARDGFYSIYFKKAVKGHHYVWIPADSTELGQPPAATSSAPSALDVPSSTSSGTEPKKPSDGKKLEIPTSRYWAGLDIMMNRMSPSTYQTAIGNEPGSFLNLSFRAEGGYRFRPKIWFTFDISRYSFSEDISTSSISGAKYSLTGTMLSAQVLYLTHQVSGITLFAGGGIGWAIHNITSGTQSGQVLTNNAKAFPLSLFVRGTRDFNKIMNSNIDLTVHADLGYRMMSIGDINYLGAPGMSTVFTSDLELSSLYLAIGVTKDF